MSFTSGEIAELKVILVEQDHEFSLTAGDKAEDAPLPRRRNVKVERFSRDDIDDGTRPLRVSQQCPVVCNVNWPVKPQRISLQVTDSRSQMRGEKPGVTSHSVLNIPYLNDVAMPNHRDTPTID